MSDAKSIGVIFDLDGTLIDSIPAYREAFTEIVRRFGRGIGPEVFDRLQGRPIPDVLRELISEGKLARRVWIYLLLNRGRIRRRIEERLSPYPGIKECLEDFKDIPLALATSGSRAHMNKTLKRFDLTRFFPVSVCRQDTENGKPAPDAFALAAARLGVAADRCVVIEDSPWGIQAARAAGMRSIALLHTSPRESFTGKSVPDHMATSVKEVTMDLVEHLLQSPLDSGSRS